MMDKDSTKPELLCRVCGDKASGKHYGVSSCDGCRGFFKRSIRRNLDYVCKENNTCIVDVTRRNQCQACRFRKCLEVNMKREAVQHERAPRATTSKPKYLSQFATTGSGGFAPYYFPSKPIFYPPFFGGASAAAAAGLTSGFPLGILPASRTALGTGNGLGSGLGVTVGAGGGGSSLFPPSGVSIGDSAASAAAAAAAAVAAAHHHHSPFTSMLVHTKRPSSSSTVSNSSNSPTDNNSSKDTTVVHTSSSNRPSADRNNESTANHHSHHNILRNGGGPPPGGMIASEDEVSSSGGEQDQQHHFSLLHSHNNHYKFLETLHVNTLVNESIYESAAKLLFLSVKWARSVPSFLNLPFEDQTLLLEEAWPELFILSGAQWGLSIDEGVLVSGSVVPRLRQSTLHADARLLRETLERIQGIRPDHTELACLKALVLFKPEIPTLREHLQVEVLQDQTHVMLQEYCIGRTPPNKIRFGKLLLLLPLIRRISGKILEELFFKQTVGDIPIERLLADMFKS